MNNKATTAANTLSYHIVAWKKLVFISNKPNTLVFVNNISTSSVHAATSARSAAESYSSGGGGFSSGGGGGGSFGGGGSMGGR